MNCTLVQAKIIIIAASLCATTASFAGDSLPSAKWARDAQHDATSLYNAAGQLAEDLPTDPSFSTVAANLQTLAHDDRYGLYPTISETTLKSAPRTYFSNVILKDVSDLHQSINGGLLSSDSQLSLDLRQLEFWINTLSACMSSETGNGPGVP